MHNKAVHHHSLWPQPGDIEETVKNKEQKHKSVKNNGGIT